MEYYSNFRNNPVTGLNLEKRREKLLAYIKIVAILITLISSLGVFVLPSIVQAKTNTVSIDDIYEAKKYINTYSDKTIEEEKLEVVDLRPTVTYSDETNIYMYSGIFTRYSTAGYRTWSHAFDLYRRGLIYGADPSYQCTFFAQMWFYDVFGFNSSGRGPSGNGGDFAYTVYNTAVYYDEDGKLQHYFELSYEPKSLSVGSFFGVSDGSGHALCIDEVDLINNTITYSEGNADGNGNVTIRNTVTISQFNAMNPGSHIYAVPTDALLKLIANR